MIPGMKGKSKPRRGQLLTAQESSWDLGWYSAEPAAAPTGSGSTVERGSKLLVSPNLLSFDAFSKHRKNP